MEKITIKLHIPRALAESIYFQAQIRGITVVEEILLILSEKYEHSKSNLAQKDWMSLIMSNYNASNSKPNT